MHLLSWTGGALLVGVDPGEAAGDPGVDPRVSLVSASGPPADHAYDGVSPGALLGHQGSATVSLTRVLAALTWHYICHDCQEDFRF